MSDLKLHKTLNSALRRSSKIIPCNQCEQKDKRIAELEAELDGLNLAMGLHGRNAVMKRKDNE